MSYPNITAEQVLNYIYAENKNKFPPMSPVMKTVTDLYNFSKGHKLLSWNIGQTEYTINLLNALTGEIPLPEEYRKGINKYYAAVNVNRFPSAPPAYIENIRAGAKRFAADYKTACEKTAETRQILAHSAFIFRGGEDSAVSDYIDYAKKYNSDRKTYYLLCELYNLGFIHGIRAERSRRNGKTIPPTQKANTAAYCGFKHRKRYKTA